MTSGDENEEPDLPPTEAMPTQSSPGANPPPLVPPPAAPVAPRGPFPWEQAAPAPSFPWEQAAPAPSFPWEQPVQARPPVGSEPLAPEAPAGGDDLDDVFGESAFQDYSDESLLATAGRARSQRRPGPQRRPDAAVATGDPAGIGRTQRTLMAVAGGLIGVLILVLAFVLGTRSGVLPHANAVPAPTPTATPTATVGVPAKPGTRPWTALMGGECIEPYTSAWERTFTVVECTAAHSAQLVGRGVFDDAATAAWPGIDKLASRTSSLCAAGTIVDYSAAKDFTDLQVTASFAPTAEDWAVGDRDYDCFVSRSGGQQLDVSLAAANAD